MSRINQALTHHKLYFLIAGAPPTRFACGRDKQVSRLTKCPIEKIRALKFTYNPYQKTRLAIMHLAQLVN
jgi:hypothetical protein